MRGELIMKSNPLNTCTSPGLGYPSQPDLVASGTPAHTLKVNHRFQMTARLASNSPNAAIEAFGIDVKLF